MYKLHQHYLSDLVLQDGYINRNIVIQIKCKFLLFYYLHLQEKLILVYKLPIPIPVHSTSFLKQTYHHFIFNHPIIHKQKTLKHTNTDSDSDSHRHSESESDSEYQIKEKLTS